jgi:hypothetical protein
MNPARSSLLGMPANPPRVNLLQAAPEGSRAWTRLPAFPGPPILRPPSPRASCSRQSRSPVSQPPANSVTPPPES